MERRERIGRLPVDEGDNADWTKQSWDLPYQTVEELRGFLQRTGMTVEEFRQLPIYRYNVSKMPWLQDL